MCPTDDMRKARREFCHLYQIDVGACQLYQGDSRLQRHQTIHQVRCLEQTATHQKGSLATRARRGHWLGKQMYAPAQLPGQCFLASGMYVQMAGEWADTISLTAAFKPSVAFYIWRVFSQKRFSHPVGLSRMWVMDMTNIVSDIRGRKSPLLQGCPDFLEYMQVYSSLARAAPTTPLVLRTSPDALPNPLQLLHDVLNELLKAAGNYDASPLSPALFAKAEAMDRASADSIAHDLRQRLRLECPEASLP